MVIIAACFLAISLSVPSGAKDLTCDSPPVGTVFCSGEDSLSVKDIAQLCAPVLWHSPDEPTRREGDPPFPFPFDRHSDEPVVYYRVPTIILNSSEPSSISDLRQPIDLSVISAVEVEFFFYYPWEEGFGSHLHDIEAIKLYLEVDHGKDDSPHALKIDRVTAFAHGSYWYDNILDVESLDESTVLALPLNVLIEEGKHASCPDINADGHYSHTYDVNEKVNDTWGIRDAIRTGSMTSPGYAGWMQKPRQKGGRVLPEHLSPELRAARRYRKSLPDTLPRYALRPFPA